MPAAGFTATSRFSGFPAGARATPVPNLLFTELLPLIDDPDELRVSFYAVYALGRRRGYPRFLTGRELMAEAPLMASLGGSSERLQAALAAAVERGTLLDVAVTAQGMEERLYLLNTPSGQRSVAQIRGGGLDLGRPLPPASAAPAAERANVYQLYEANIGPLTPLVAEQLKEAEQLYPADWIEDAFREAASLNHRSWRYASRILERWAAEGRRREEAGRDPGADDSLRAQLIRRFDRLAGR
jgi:DnaD/phage-associated family protein